MAAAYNKLEDYANARTYFQKSLTEHRTPETLSKLSEVNFSICCIVIINRIVLCQGGEKVQGGREEGLP